MSAPRVATRLNLPAASAVSSAVPSAPVIVPPTAAPTAGTLSQLVSNVTWSVTHPCSITETVNGSPGFARAGATSSSSSGFGAGKLSGARKTRNSSPFAIGSWSAPTLSSVWFRFRYQKVPSWSSIRADRADREPEPELVGDRERAQVRVRARRARQQAERGRLGELEAGPAAAGAAEVAVRRRVGGDPLGAGQIRRAGVEDPSRGQHAKLGALRLGARERGGDREQGERAQRGERESREGTACGHQGHPFLEGRVGWPGQVSWLPGRSSRLPEVALAISVADVSHATPCCPVTVAGPRRFLTGLPLTTDRMSATTLAPPGTSGQ